MYYQAIGNPLERALDKLLRGPIKPGLTVRLIASNPESALAAPVLRHIRTLRAHGAMPQMIFTALRHDAAERCLNVPDLARGVAEGWVRVPAIPGADRLQSQLLIADSFWIVDRTSGMPQAVTDAAAIRAAHASFRLVAQGCHVPQFTQKRFRFSHLLSFRDKAVLHAA